VQELPSLYWLAGHLQSEALVDPARELWPMGHVLQEGCTEKSMYWSAGHLMQLDSLVDPAGEA
jgi:hypothetical protein